MRRTQAKKTVSVTFSVRFDQLEQLEHLSEREQRSRSTLVQEALDAFIARLRGQEVPKVALDPQRVS